jgi:predicted nuclease with TOPRIM domain
MTAEERIRQLEAENAALREQLAEALEYLGQALERIHELEGQLAKESHTSLKHRHVMAPDASVGASAIQARSRREGSQGMLDTV